MTPLRSLHEVGKCRLPMTDDFFARHRYKLLPDPLDVIRPPRFNEMREAFVGAMRLPCVDEDHVIELVDPSDYFRPQRMCDCHWIVPSLGFPVFAHRARTWP